MMRETPQAPYRIVPQNRLSIEAIRDRLGNAKMLIVECGQHPTSKARWNRVTFAGRKDSVCTLLHELPDSVMAGTTSS